MNAERNRRILIIDDTRSIHDDFRKILGGWTESTSLGSLEEDEKELFGATPRPAVPVYEVVSAYQGQEGVELVQRAIESKQRFALAFIDMRMPPGWDGLETIERIWALDPDIQVVICTAHSDRSWEQIVARLGIVDRLLILKKPFDAAEVSQCALSLTEKWNNAESTRMELKQLKAMVGEQARSPTPGRP
jgi:two-component system, NtrC family, sensor kinase